MEKYSASNNLIYKNKPQNLRTQKLSFSFLRINQPGENNNLNSSSGIYCRGGSRWCKHKARGDTIWISAFFSALICQPRIRTDGSGGATDCTSWCAAARQPTHYTAGAIKNALWWCRKKRRKKDGILDGAWDFEGTSEGDSNGEVEGCKRMHEWNCIVSDLLQS